MLERLRGGGPGHIPCVQQVSRIVHAARAHAERCRDALHTRTSAEGLGTDFGDLRSPPQIYHGYERHGFEVSGTLAK